MRWLIVLPLLVVITSCSAPEAPLAQVAPPSPAPAATTAATLVPVQATVAPLPSAVPIVQPSEVATAEILVSPMPLVSQTFAAAGEGILLRDLLSQQILTTTASRTLIYSEIADSRSKTNAFWAIELHNPAQRRLIAEVTSDWFLHDVLFGRLSADGIYLAYLDPVKDETASLKVIRTDGSDQRRVTYGMSPTASYELPTFAWAPSGSLLAYMRHWKQVQSFFVYDAATGGEPREIAQVGGAAFGGWLDDQHLLIYIVTDPQEHLQLTSINVVTGEQEALGRFPRDGIFYSQFAPDRRTVWMADYLFDVTTRSFTPLDPVGGPFVWAGSQLLLKVPQINGKTAQVIALAQSDQGMPIAFLPPFDVTEGFTLQGASPDGRYIIGCGGYDDTATGRTVYRSLLYDVSANQWHILTEGNYCGDVVGWTTR